MRTMYRDYDLASDDFLRKKHFSTFKIELYKYVFSRKPNCYYMDKNIHTADEPSQLLCPSICVASR